MNRNSHSVLLILLSTAVLTNCQDNNRQGQSASQNASQPDLVVVTYGGEWGAAVKAAFVEPFERHYGVDIQLESWGGEMGRLKAMVESGQVGWDVVDVEAYMVPLLTTQGLIAPVVIDSVLGSELLPEAQGEYGVATCFWSTVIAFRPGLTAEPRGPGDFLDISRFPGRRALRDDPVANLEIALLADGVSPQNLYPLDIERALRALEPLRALPSDQFLLWDGGQEPVDMLTRDVADISTVWNGRVYNEVARGALQVIWNGGVISSDWWVVPKGTRRLELAQQFIAFASSRNQQTAMTMNIPYGPVNQLSLQDIDPNLLRNLPTAPENMRIQVFLDPDYWAQNIELVLERWNSWIGGKLP